MPPSSLSSLAAAASPATSPGLGAFLTAPPSAAELKLADFAAERISARWKAHWFGCEMEFGGLRGGTATYAVASAITGSRIDWRSGGDERSGTWHGGGTAGSDTVYYKAGHRIHDPNSVIRNDAWKQEGDPTAYSHTGISGQNQNLELVSPVLSWEKNATTLARVLTALRALGATTSENCGGHIHIDATQLSTDPARYVADARRIMCLISLVGRNEPLIVNSLAIHANRYPHGYARAIPLNVLRRLKSAHASIRTAADLAQTIGAHARGAGPLTHAYGINLDHALWPSPPKITIELRYFNGTVDPDIELSNVQLALALAIYTHECRTARFDDQRGWPPDNAAWDMRIFLLSLGLMGDEFARTREVLTRNLPGHPAYRTQVMAQAAGRPFRAAPTAQSGETQTPNYAREQAADPARLRDAANWTLGLQKDVWYYRLPADTNSRPRYYAVQLALGVYYATLARTLSDRWTVHWIDTAGAASLAATGEITFPRREEAFAACATHLEGFAEEERREAARRAERERQASEAAAAEAARRAEAERTAREAREAEAREENAFPRSGPTTPAPGIRPWVAQAEMALRGLLWSIAADENGRPARYMILEVAPGVTWTYWLRQTRAASAWLVYFIVSAPMEVARVLGNGGDIAYTPGSGRGAIFSDFGPASDAAIGHVRGGSRVDGQGAAPRPGDTRPPAGVDLNRPTWRPTWSQSAAPPASTPEGATYGRPPEGATAEEILAHAADIANWPLRADGLRCYLTPRNVGRGDLWCIAPPAAGYVVGVRLADGTLNWLWSSFGTFRLSPGRAGAWVFPSIDHALAQIGLILRARGDGGGRLPTAPVPAAPAPGTRLFETVRDATIESHAVRATEIRGRHWTGSADTGKSWIIRADDVQPGATIAYVITKSPRRRHTSAYVAYARPESPPGSFMAIFLDSDGLPDLSGRLPGPNSQGPSLQGHFDTLTAAAEAIAKHIRHRGPLTRMSR